MTVSHQFWRSLKRFTSTVLSTSATPAFSSLHAVPPITREALTRSAGYRVFELGADSAATLKTRPHLHVSFQMPCSTAFKVWQGSVPPGCRAALRTIVKNGKANGMLFVGTAMPMVLGALCPNSMHVGGVGHAECMEVYAHQHTPPLFSSSEAWHGLAASVRRAVCFALDLMQTFWRLLQLGAVFMPCAALLPGCLLIGWARRAEDRLDAWYPLLTSALQLAGPTFIKLGQWASTRPDVFPQGMCARLSALHSSVAPESFAATRRTVEASLGGAAMADVFLEFDRDPLGSGCVAQVHRAVLRDPGQHPQTQVWAVKVKRARVDAVVARDLLVMRTLAAIVAALPIPGVQYLALPAAVNSFAEHMTAQLNLKHEANNLQRFGANFKRSSHVVFPLVCPSIPPTDQVLIETYEPGQGLLEWAQSPNTSMESKKALALPMVEAFFQMVLEDNLVHGDLHPGNILVRNDYAEGSNDGSLSNGVKFVFVDTGLCVELSPEDQRNFIDLFTAVAKGKGREAALLMLERSKQPHGHHKNPEMFVEKMSQLVNQVTATKFTCSDVKIGEVLQEVMSMARNHHVMVDSQFATLVISITILEGIGRQLFPDLDLFAVALPILARGRKQYTDAATGVVMDRARKYFSNIFGVSMFTDDIVCS